MAKRKRLGELLVEACIITQEQLEDGLHIQKSNPRLIGQILVEMGWVSEKEVCRAVSELLNVDFVDVEGALVSQEVVQLAPENLATKRNLLPLFVQDKTLYVAMSNPLDVDVIQRIEFRTGMQVKPLIAPPSQLKETVRKHYDVDEYVGNMLGNVVEEEAFRVTEEEETENTVDVSEIRKISEGSQIVRLANLVISDGIKKRASDIHLEPTSKYINVRYRIDGLLTRGIQVPKWLQSPLISRVKVIAGMDIAEHRKPQDGRISVTYAQRKIDLRVSTLLTNFGEKVVIRILDKSTSSHDLSKLGISPKYLHLYWGMLRQPQGWILVTGPTGSGKTTTLYASLNTVKDTTKNIVTVEDPIEYQLAGINQVQINPKAGVTFANGLRAILRQDPNIIMVGEIRDNETAEVAMQAAETGHLMLSTLHTNDAVSTVNRLFSLGLSPDLVASNLLVVIAQRLVRKICPRCKIEYPPTEEELQQIGIFHTANPEIKFYKGRGCPSCNQTGYHGQIGIYELLVQNDKLRDAIAQRPTKQALKRLARATGMKTMLEDGIDKIRQGITTIEEVARVCPIDPKEFPDSAPCPECGKLIARSEPICPYCDHVLHPTCPECRASLEKDWVFCPFCGIHILDAASTLSQDSSGTSQSIINKRSIRILVADDDAPVREMLRTLLEQQGYQVVQAKDGAEALERIHAELPDLVILDVNMPRQDGFTVCKTIRSAVDTMFIPVIMLTGRDSVEEKMEGLAYGADEYITKPFDAYNLLAQIRNVLQRSSQHKVGEEPSSQAEIVDKE